MDNIITLNVGGKKISTYKNTLFKSEYFKSYVNRWNKDGVIFIDQDPKLFSHVLNYLRNDEYIIPKKYKENIDKLLEYYLIPTDKNVNSKSNTLVKMYVTDNIVVNKDRYSYSNKNDYVFSFDHMFKQNYYNFELIDCSFDIPISNIRELSIENYDKAHKILKHSGLISSQNENITLSKDLLKLLSDKITDKKGLKLVIYTIDDRISSINMFVTFSYYCHNK